MKIQNLTSNKSSLSSPKHQGLEVLYNQRNKIEKTETGKSLWKFKVLHTVWNLMKRHKPWKRNRFIKNWKNTTRPKPTRSFTAIMINWEIKRKHEAVTIITITKSMHKAKYSLAKMYQCQRWLTWSLTKANRSLTHSPRTLNFHQSFKRSPVSKFSNKFTKWQKKSKSVRKRDKTSEKISSLLTRKSVMKWEVEMRKIK